MRRIQIAKEGIGDVVDQLRVNRPRSFYTKFAKAWEEVSKAEGRRSNGFKPEKAPTLLTGGRRERGDGFHKKSAIML